MQILAVKLQKKVEYFKVRWQGISEKGDTWEPAAHLEGDEAKAALHVFKEKRAADLAAVQEQRRARAAGNGDSSEGAAEAAEDNDVQIVEQPNQCRKRKAQSDVWKWYTPKYYDASRMGTYAKCRHCLKPIKVVNTSNLSAHISQKHPELMAKDKEKVLKVCHFVSPTNLLIV